MTLIKSKKKIFMHLPWKVLKRGVYGFEKDIDVDLFQIDLFPSHYRDLFTNGDDTDIVKFENAKVQNSVGLKYKFYKSNVEGIFVQERLQSVNKIGQQVYL